MSETKKKSPLIALVAVICLAAAGGVAYMAKQKDTAHEAGDAHQHDSHQHNADNTQEAPSVETASGDATQPTKEVVSEQKEAAIEAANAANLDGINVEQGNPIVAKVDGKDITRVDVYRFIQTMPANVQQMPAIEVYPVAMEQVINTRIVQTQADKASITESDEFKRELEMAKQQIARNLYLQKEVDAKITDKMIKKAYDDYAKNIPDVEERRARHILVETEDKAKAVVDKLKKGGKFEELASELSIGPTASKGGDLGYFTKTEMVPEFANAAFGMDKGAVLDTPVKTQFGWHVIQLVDVRQRPKPSLEQMTPALRAELTRTTLDDLLVKWRKNAKVEQFDINGKPLKEGANVIGIVPKAAEAAPEQGKTAPAKTEG